MNDKQQQPPQQQQQPPGQFADYGAREREVAALRAAIDADRAAGLARARQYANHPSEDLRRDVYAMLWKLGKESKDAEQRRQIVDVLVEGVKLEDGWIGEQLLKWLKDFSVQDFSEASRKILEGLPWPPGDSAALILVLGIADVESAVPVLQKLAAEAPDTSRVGWHTRDEWAAHLALARMGDARYTRRVVAAVVGEKDIIVRPTLLFQDLGYTLRPEALDALRRFLASEERLPQIKDNVPGRPEALYAAEVLLRCVRNPPIDRADLRESDLPVIRAWAMSQREWDVLR